MANTQEALAADTKFLADMKKTCAGKQKERDIRSKTRSEEMLALADKIKILNDDHALDQCKKALPAVDLLQTKVTAEEVKKQALEALTNIHENLQIALISLASNGKKVSFDKVIGMIDKLVVLLQEEQGTVP